MTTIRFHHFGLRLPGVAAVILTAATIAGCTSGSGPSTGPARSRASVQSGSGTLPPGALKVPIFTPAPRQAIGGFGLLEPHLRLNAAVRAGYACFTLNGRPAIWPSGFSAVRDSRGHLTVRTASGSLLINGDAYQFGAGEVSSTGSPCSARGADVLDISSVQRGLPPGYKSPRPEPSDTEPPPTVPLPTAASSAGTANAG